MADRRAPGGSALPVVAGLRPIDTGQQQRVIACTQACLARATIRYGRKLPPVEVLFDLGGQAAGQFRWTARSRQCVIRYNPWVFAADFEHHLLDTVMHEVAHYIVYCLHGARVRPHGAEWRRVMQDSGAEPKATGRYPLHGVPVRRQQRHAYHCACRTHELTSTRHNRQQRGSAYICRHCGTPLQAVHGGEAQSGINVPCYQSRG